MELEDLKRICDKFEFRGNSGDFDVWKQLGMPNIQEDIESCKYIRDLAHRILDSPMGSELQVTTALCLGMQIGAAYKEGW